MSKIIGQSKIELRLSGAENGTIKFSSSDKITKYPVSSIQFVTATASPLSLTGNPYKANARNAPFFLNIFDSYENQFIYDAPLNLFSNFSWGRELQFEPRYLDLSSCYVRFFNQANVVGSIGLILTYAK